MELKHKVKSVYTVNYTDLDKFICKVYGLTDFNSTGEQDNDTIIEVDVDRHPLSEWDREAVEKSIASRYCEGWNLRRLMTDMCNKGHIEPGTYMIDVSW